MVKNFLKWKKTKNITIILLFSIVGIVFFFTINNDMEKLNQLEVENQHLTEENKELRAQKDYLDNQSSQENNQQDTFSNWVKLERVADDITDNSDGKFKKSWALFLAKEAQKKEVDPYIVYELLKVETGGTFDPELVGPQTKYGQAYGMAQFMKNTAPWIADMADLPYEDELLFDPYYSIQLSIVYLNFLHHQYGEWDKTLTAYHRGIGGLEQYIEHNGHAESSYAQQIQAEAEEHRSLAMK